MEGGNWSRAPRRRSSTLVDQFQAGKHLPANARSAYEMKVLCESMYVAKTFGQMNLSGVVMVVVLEGIPAGRRR